MTDSSLDKLARKREADLERLHAKVAAAVAAGLCRQCFKNPVKPGNTRCPACLDKTAARDKARRSAMWAAGRCQNCGQLLEPTRQGHCFCAACARRQSAQYPKRTAERLAAGVCINCGRRPPKDGCKTCEVCLQREKDRYNKLKAAGICTRCGAVPARPGCCTCAACAEFDKMRMTGRALKK